MAISLEHYSNIIIASATAVHIDIDVGICIAIQIAIHIDIHIDIYIDIYIDINTGHISNVANTNAIDA